MISSKEIECSELYVLELDHYFTSAYYLCIASSQLEVIITHVASLDSSRYNLISY